MGLHEGQHRHRPVPLLALAPPQHPPGPNNGIAEGREVSCLLALSTQSHAHSFHCVIHLFIPLIQFIHSFHLNHSPTHFRIRVTNSFLSLHCSIVCSTHILIPLTQ